MTRSAAVLTESGAKWALRAVVWSLRWPKELAGHWQAFAQIQGPRCVGVLKIGKAYFVRAED